MTLDQVEASTAASLRAFLDASKGGSVVEQDDHLRWIAAGLEHLLTRLLADSEGWSPYAWIDGVLPIAVSVPSPLECELRGAAVWDDGSGGQWLEPFSAQLVLTAESDALAAYRVCFADATRGLGLEPYSERGVYLTGERQTTDWLYLFERAATNP